MKEQCFTLLPFILKNYFVCCGISLQETLAAVINELPDYRGARNYITWLPEIPPF